MADIKTQKELNDLIKQQKNALDDLTIGSKKYLDTQKQIVLLEKQKKDLLKQQKDIADDVGTDQVSFQSKFNKLLADTKTKEQDLAKTSGTAAKFRQGQSVNQINLLQSMAKQIGITKKTQGETNKETENTYNALKKVAEEELNIGQLEEMIAESKGRQRNLSKEYQPLLHQNEEALGRILEDQLDIAEAQELVNKGVDRMKNIIAGITFAGLMASLLKLAKSFAERMDAIGDTFGSIDSLGPSLVNSLNAQGAEAVKLGKGQKDVLDTTTVLSAEFGLSLEAATQLSGEVLKTAKATGLSNEEAARLVGTFDQIAGLSGKEASNLVEATSQLAVQRGVAPQQVLKDIAGSSETIATFTKEGGENLMEAAIAARQMGLNIESVAKSAEAVLDFETSIAAETEASVLLGQQLNLQRARQLALDKDLVGFQKEIKEQIGGIGDFTELNRFQQESLSKALGMTISETAKLVSGTQKLTLEGALAAGSFEDLTGQEALSNLSKITNEVKALFEEALIMIGPEIENLAGKFKTWIKDSGGIGYLKDTLFGMVSGLKMLLTSLPQIIGLFASYKAVTIGLAMAKVALAAAEGAAMAPWLLGGGAVLMIAGILGAIASASSVIMADDVQTGPGGISYMTGPAGTFKLNPRDSVLATTNPIPVNDIATGNIVGGNTDSTSAIVNEIRAMRNDNANNKMEIRLDKLSQGLDPNYGGVT